MVDESETAPLPDPVPQPAPADTPAPAAGPAPAVTPAPAARPAAAAVTAPKPDNSRRNRRLGLAAQVAGVVGIVICLVLVAGVLVGRGWATDTVSTVSADIDAKLAKAVPLLDAASSKTSEIAGRVGAVSDAANAMAGQASPNSGLLQGLQGAVTNVSNRYLELRASYGDFRQTVTGAIDGLQTLERLIPGFSIPQGPVDALNKLDAAVTALDTRIMGVADAIPASGPISAAAAAIATKAGDIATGLQSLTATINDAQARLAELRAQLDSTTGTIRTSINLGSFGLILILLWVAVLHWVLFRTGRRLRAEASAG